MITKTSTHKRKYITKVSFVFIALMILCLTGVQAQITVSIGSTGTGTSFYWPNYYLYGYSYSQQIVEVSEINSGGWSGGAALISKIRYKPTVSVPTALWQSWVIYLGNTTKTSFSSYSDWIPDTSMTQVFNGNLPTNVTANVWMEITLPTPFLWDGTSNLVIAVDENTPNWGNNPNWAGYITTPGKAIWFYDDGINPDPAAPPVSGGAGQGINTSSINVAQIQFEFTGATPCSGTPSPGSTLTGTTYVCADTVFTLSLQNNPPVSGFTYQWQSSTDSVTWTNIGTSYPTQSLTQNATTWYQCIVTCSNTGQSATSAPVQVIMIPLASCYCASSANFPNFEDVFRVTIGTLNNTSDCITPAPGPGSVLSRYSNFMAGTGIPAAPDVVLGTVTPISLQVGICGASGANMTKIFIDLNQNGLFTDPGEQVYVSSNYSNGAHTENASISIPMTATLGLTAMRVVTASTTLASTITPCGTYDFGETEDYLINITPTVGYQEDLQARNSKLKVYPNPTTDILSVEYSAIEGTAQITVLDISGRTMLAQTQTNVTGKNTTQLDLSKLSKGVYLLNVKTKNNDGRVRVVVD